MLVNADLPELKYADLQYLDQKLGYDMSEHDEVHFEKIKSPILLWKFCFRSLEIVQKLETNSTFIFINPCG